MNKRLLPTRKIDDDFSIVLTSINAIADRVNLQKLVELTKSKSHLQGQNRGRLSFEVISGLAIFKSAGRGSGDDGEERPGGKMGEWKYRQS